MNFIKYCELPENESWITQMMWKMKLDTGFDEQALDEAICEQADLEGLDITADDPEACAVFLAEWYDELDYNESGAI